MNGTNGMKLYIKFKDIDSWEPLKFVWDRLQFKLTHLEILRDYIIHKN